MAVSRTATLADVARIAGVSASTASRVLNGSAASVSTDLRKRVTAVADSLGYVSNRAAQALRGRRNHVFMLVSEPRNAPIAAQAAGMEAAARERGVLASVIAVSPSATARAAAIDLLRSLKPRALIINYVEADGDTVEPHLRAFGAEGGRVIAVGGRISGFSSVRFADQEGARAMGRHLAELGRHRIACIEGDHPAFRTRIAAVIDELAYAGIASDDVVIERCPFSREGALEATARLIEQRPFPDLIYTANDILAVGVLTGLRRAGLRVPEDIAVASHDDIPLAREVTPTLTTVAMDFEAAGRAALEMALSDTEPGDVHLPGRLVIRESTRVGQTPSSARTPLPAARSRH